MGKGFKFGAELFQDKIKMLLEMPKENMIMVISLVLLFIVIVISISRGKFSAIFDASGNRMDASGNRISASGNRLDASGNTLQERRLEERRVLNIINQTNAAAARRLAALNKPSVKARIKPVIDAIKTTVNNLTDKLTGK